MTRVVADFKVWNLNIVPDDCYVLSFTICKAVGLGPDHGNCEIVWLFKFDSSLFNYIERDRNLRSSHGLAVRIEDLWACPFVSERTLLLDLRHVRNRRAAGIKD